VVDSIAVRRVWQQFSRLNPSVYSIALRGGCCVPPCVADVSIVNCAVCQQFNKQTLLLLFIITLSRIMTAHCCRLPAETVMAVTNYKFGIRLDLEVFTLFGTKQWRRNCGPHNSEKHFSRFSGHFTTSLFVATPIRGHR